MHLTSVILPVSTSQIYLTKLTTFIHHEHSNAVYIFIFNKIQYKQSLLLYQNCEYNKR